MASISFKTGDEYALKLSRLASGREKIARKAIYEAAGIVADKIKGNLIGNLKDPAYVGKGESVWGVKNSYLTGSSAKGPTGDLLESFGITPFGRDKDGNWNVKIGFDGYDRRGVPNQLKARVMESGSSTLKKRPFVRPAVNATKKKAVDAMRKVIDEEIEKMMGGK